MCASQGVKKILDFKNFCLFSVMLPKSRPVGDTVKGNNKATGSACLQRGGTVRHSVPALRTIRHGPKFRPGPACQAQAAKWGGAPVNYYLLGKGKGSPLPVEERKKNHKYRNLDGLKFSIFVSEQIVICSGIIS
jgi:hypothetical protein